SFLRSITSRLVPSRGAPPPGGPVARPGTAPWPGYRDGVYRPLEAVRNRRADQAGGELRSGGWRSRRALCRIGTSCQDGTETATGPHLDAVWTVGCLGRGGDCAAPLHWPADLRGCRTRCRRIAA